MYKRKNSPILRVLSVPYILPVHKVNGLFFPFRHVQFEGAAFSLHGREASTVFSILPSLDPTQPIQAHVIITGGIVNGTLTCPAG